MLCTTFLCSCHKMGPINEKRAEGKYKGTYTTSKSTYDTTRVGWVTTRTSSDMEVFVYFEKDGDAVISSYGTLTYDRDKEYNSTINGNTTAVFDPRNKLVKISYNPPYSGLGAPPGGGSVFVGEKE